MACVCNEHAAGPEVAIAEFSYLAAMSFMGMMRISRFAGVLGRVPLCGSYPHAKAPLQLRHPLPFQQWCKVDEVHAIDTPS